MYFLRMCAYPWRSVGVASGQYLFADPLRKYWENQARISGASLPPGSGQPDEPHPQP